MKVIYLYYCLFICVFLQPLAAQMRYHNMEIVVGAEQYAAYQQQLEGKNVACVVNQTSTMGTLHLVDFFRQKKVKITKIFAPEHGFRGEADAGEHVKDGKDSKTGLPVFSLHGKHKKPTAAMLAGVDIVVFDIQDVGARFYTYISTLHYVMEACAEQGIKVLVLDRPNPNGHYVDGFVLEKQHESFVGMHPIPVVHGMTVGELACMINQEGWLKNAQGKALTCDVEVVECTGYDHSKFYNLPVKPSPNLPNSNAIYLYPSLCFFEATQVSVGRGTDKQFQIMGFPNYVHTASDTMQKLFKFTPVSKAGAKQPPFENEACNGVDFSGQNAIEFRAHKQIKWEFLIQMYEAYVKTGKKDFFLDTNFIHNLAGTAQLKQAIIAGKSANEIRALYAQDLEKFKILRKKYLLYKDFEQEK